MMKTVNILMLIIFIAGCSNETTKNEGLLEANREAEIAYVDPATAGMIISFAMSVVDGVETKRYRNSTSRKLEHITNLLNSIKSTVENMNKTLNRVEKNTIKIIGQNNELLMQGEATYNMLERIEKTISQIYKLQQQANLEQSLNEYYRKLETHIRTLEKIGEKKYHKKIELIEALNEGYNFVIENEFRPEKYIMLVKYSEFLNVANKEDLDIDYTSRKFIDAYFRNILLFDTIYFEKRIESMLFDFFQKIEFNNNGQFSDLILKHNITAIKKNGNIRKLELKFKNNSVSARELQNDIIQDFEDIINLLDTYVFLKKVVLPDVNNYVDICIKRNNYALLSYYREKLIKQ